MHSESTFSYHPAWYNWIFKATLSACHSATAENITWHLNFIGVKTNQTNTQHSSNSSPKISLDRVLSMEGKSLYKSWPRATFWYRGALRNPVIENPWPRCSSLQSDTRPSTSTKCWPPCSRRSPGMGPDALETTLFCTVDQTRWIWRASAACPCRRQLGLPQAEEQLTRQKCALFQWNSDAGMAVFGWSSAAPCRFVLTALTASLWEHREKQQALWGGSSHKS